MTETARTTLLLDAGGVLLDESEYELRVCEVVTEVVGSIDSTYTANHYWDDTAEAIARFAPSTPRYVMWKRCGHDDSVYREWLKQYAEAMKTRPPMKLFDQVVDEIPLLAASWQLVLAGQYGADLYELLACHDLEKHFRNRLSQDDFPITKPDPRYVAAIASASGVDAAECIVVGDRIDKDVIPARQNGMGSVFVRTGIYRDQEPRTPEEKPDLVVDSLTGLSRAIAVRWPSPGIA